MDEGKERPDFSAGEAAEERKICERLLSAPEYARFQKILVYAAIRSEVELQLFCDQALRDRKQIFSRRCAGRKWSFTGLRIPDS